MADDKSERGKPDRSWVAGGEGYEVNYFARKHEITAQQARDLIKRVGEAPRARRMARSGSYRFIFVIEMLAPAQTI